MKNQFLVIFFSEILLTSSLLVNAQEPNLIYQFEKSSIKQKMDSIKRSLVNDTNRNEILFFNSNFLNRGASGCKIVMEDDSTIIEKIVLNSSNSSEKEISNLDSKPYIDYLKKFFLTPNKFIDTSFLLHHRNLSHDNIIYLFIKVDKHIFFDKFFPRSYFLGTSNENSFNLMLFLEKLSI